MPSPVQLRIGQPCQVRKEATASDEKCVTVSLAFLLFPR